jgi:hypothetical protein
MVVQEVSVSSQVQEADSALASGMILLTLVQ